MFDEFHISHCHPFTHPRRRWGRWFLTKEELKEIEEHKKTRKIEWLERYKESLEKELTGVQERLDELKKETQ